MEGPRVWRRSSELARGLPRLLLMSRLPAPGREPGLAGLLGAIEYEEEASAYYRTFGTPGQLGRLVRDDLATLLSERFASGPPAASAVARTELA